MVDAESRREGERPSLEGRVVDEGDRGSSLAEGADRRGIASALNLHVRNFEVRVSVRVVAHVVLFGVAWSGHRIPGTLFSIPISGRSRSSTSLDILRERTGSPMVAADSRTPTSVAPIRHISCGLARPLGARLFPRRFQGHMECHCLVVGEADRLVLIDAGLSLEEQERPKLLGPLARSLGFVAAPERAAVRQLAELGLDPGAVTDIVMTHLDLDHVGGVRDFPEARVHVHAREASAARARRSFGEKLRYRPYQLSGVDLVTHGDAESEAVATRTADGQWVGTIPVLEIGGWRVELVPFFGHTRGHCGVRLHGERGEMLHVGDAYYDRSELTLPGGLFFDFFRRTLNVEPRRAATVRECLREWADNGVEVFSSHDPGEFARAVEATRSPR